MAVIALRLLHKQVTLKGGGHALNAATVATHLVGGVMLALGYFISGLRG
jgi:hypothetical protein